MTNECHRLSTADDGRVQFAYGAHTAPWHRLGTPMAQEDLTVEKMLEAAQADEGEHLLGARLHVAFGKAAHL